MDFGQVRQGPFFYLHSYFNDLYIFMSAVQGRPEPPLASGAMPDTWATNCSDQIGNIFELTLTLDHSRLHLQKGICNNENVSYKKGRK